MVSFESYILRQRYQKVAALGDKRSRVDDLINWQPFRKIVSGIYDNTSPKGGRPSTTPYCYDQAPAPAGLVRPA